MAHSLLRARPTTVVVAVTVAVLAWFTTDLQGASRAFTALLAFAAAYLAFNAGAAYFDVDE